MQYKSLSYEGESARMNSRVKGNERIEGMMVGITSNKRNVGLQQFLVRITLNHTSITT
jgi:hypothetical protein